MFVLGLVSFRPCGEHAHRAHYLAAFIDEVLCFGYINASGAFVAKFVDVRLHYVRVGLYPRLVSRLCASAEPTVAAFTVVAFSDNKRAVLGKTHAVAVWGY